MPLLLRQLELAGCIVTVDALNTQKTIAREIVEADADYVLALKGNHPLLHREVSDFLLDAKERAFAGVAHDFFEEADKGHGRLKVRRHWITSKIDWITPRAEWEGLRCVGLVERAHHTPAGVSMERAFYLYSIPADAKLFARAVRGHRGVENSLLQQVEIHIRPTLELIGELLARGARRLSNGPHRHGAAGVRARPEVRQYRAHERVDRGHARVPFHALRPRIEDRFAPGGEMSAKAIKEGVRAVDMARGTTSMHRDWQLAVGEHTVWHHRS